MTKIKAKATKRPTKTATAKAAAPKKSKPAKKVTLAARFAKLKKTMKDQIAKIKMPAL